MKRQADSTPLPGRPARRQPQTSCDSCRRKKLKCDREQPCSSCRVRGLPCSLSTSAQSSPLKDTPDSASSFTTILSRLAALEQAVFHEKSIPKHGTPNSHQFIEPTISSSEREDRQVAKFLDVAHHRSLADKHHEEHLETFVGESWQHSVAMATGSSKSPIWLPPHSDANALVQDFVENACHLMPIIHIASTRAIVDGLYSILASKNPQKVDPSHIALILSVCATCAFFWNATVPCQHTFTTEEAAMEASGAWSMSALEALEHAHRTDCKTLEGAQTYAILAYLAYNTYGPSRRFHHLHARAVTTCRDLRIHLTDSRAYDLRDDAATREIQRRLWWHLTANDWMLSHSGGPLDGTYTIQPRHMKVSMPRNLNDAELNIDSDALTYPAPTVTQTSCFLQAIRLGEVCRAVVDSRDPDDDTLDKAHNDHILTLDSLFREALDAFPPALALNAPIQQSAPRFLCLQRASIHMGFHSRRARLHHPFLIHKDVHGQPDPQFGVSRQICVQSARTVLDIAISLMDHSLLKKHEPSLPPQPSQESPSILQHIDHEKCPGFPAHRLGVVVNHLFWACAILSFDSNLRRAQSGTAHERSAHQGASTADSENDLHERLVRACRLLAVLGKQCPTIGGIINGMRRVFIKYHIRGGEAITETEAEQSSVEVSISSTNGIGQASNGGSCVGNTGYSGLSIGDGDMGNQDLFENVDVASGLDIGILEDFFISSSMQNHWDQMMGGMNPYPGW